MWHFYILKAMSVGGMANLVSPNRNNHYEEFDDRLTLAYKLSTFSLDIRENGDEEYTLQIDRGR